MDVDLRQYGRLLRRWWWLLLVGAILPALISGYTLMRQTPMYRARVTLLVGSSLQGYQADYMALETSASLARMYGDLARRPLITQAVISKLKLPQSPEQLAEQITALVPADSQMLELTVIDRNPDAAQAIGNALAEALIKQTPAGQQSTQDQLAFTQQQLGQVEQAIKSLQDQLAKANTAIKPDMAAADLEKAQTDVATLRTMLDAQRSTYANLLSLYREGASSARLTIVEPAQKGAPISKHAPLVVAVAMLAGVVLAGGGIFVSEQLDDTLRWEGPEQRSALGLPVLGALARVPRRAGPLFFRQDPCSRAAQALCDLRTRLWLAGANGRPRSFLIASPGRLDGKSFVATALAAAMARAGVEVVLVDADLRNPALHQILTLKSEPGLADALLAKGSADQALKQVLQPTHQEHLWLIAAGRPSPEASLALASQRLQEIVRLLGERFDLIIFDSPAEMLAPEAAALASVAEATALVVSQDWTRRGHALRSAQAIAGRPGANVIGVIFNRVRLGGRGVVHGSRHQVQTAAGAGSEPARPGEPGAELLPRSPSLAAAPGVTGHEDREHPMQKERRQR